MREVGGLPRGRHVTGFTRVARSDVPGVLARGRRAVVAREAGALDLGVVDTRAGFHAVVTWQDSQLRVEDRCAACLPVALVPLWQLAHSLTMPVCVNDAGFHVAVPWQAPHSAAVAICVACLPVAVVPL